MKIKIHKIEDQNTKVPINSDAHRIEEIKNEIADCSPDAEICKVEVVDMWADMPEE